MQSYKLKLTALTPIHIGTGEVYEPTNFVIDDGHLYEFDEVLFYKSLSELDKKALDSKLGNWMQIIDFYKSKAKEAKQIASFHCIATAKVIESYKKIKNSNQFQIAKTFKNPNTHRAIIPGSSIKGMLDTVLKIYPAKIKENESRQKLIISDALLLDGSVEIGFSYRVHKNPSKEAKSKIPQMVEIIKPDSSFVCHVKTELAFEKLKELMKNYRRERQGDFFQEDNKSFVARVGKFCGKEYMVDDGRNVTNSYGKPIATHTLYENGGNSFGWIRFELISDEEYQNGLNSIQAQEEAYFKELTLRQKEIRETIQIAKEQAQEEALLREQKRVEAKQELEDAKKAEAQKLANMSPLERKIAELESATPMPKTTLLLKNLQNGVLEEFKNEALTLLKSLMIQNKEWKEQPTGKNPAKDKEYQKTLEVKKLFS